jgi:hypothetical protein
MPKSEVVIEGLDVIDVIGETSRKNRKFAAIFLNELDILVSDVKLKKEIRKLFLDNQNNYTRSIIAMIFGDVEGLESAESNSSESSSSK